MVAASRARSSSLKPPAGGVHQRPLALLDGPGGQAEPLQQLADHELAAEHADRPGQRRRQGDDHVGRAGDVVAAGRGHVAHRHDHRLAGLADPAHLAPDHLRRDRRAAGRVDPQHDGARPVVLAGGPQLGADRVAADLAPAEPAPGPAGDDRRRAPRPARRGPRALRPGGPPGRAATGRRTAARRRSANRDRTTA